MSAPAALSVHSATKEPESERGWEFSSEGQQGRGRKGLSCASCQHPGLRTGQEGFLEEVELIGWAFSGSKLHHP